MRPLTLTVIVLASALGLAGCGSNDSSNSSSTPSADTSSSTTTTTTPSPSDTSDGQAADFANLSGKEITDAAKQATTGVTSLHLAGTITQSGEQESLDLQLDDQGECQGTLGIGGKGSAKILGVGGDYWFKPDDAFWRSYAGAAADKVIAVVGDRYVKNADLATVCDLNDFLGGTKSSSDKSHPVVGGLQTIDGQETVKVTTTNGSGTSTGFVLTSSPHYLVKLEREGTAPGAFTFSDFGASLDVTAPTASEQVDLSELGG